MRRILLIALVSAVVAALGTGAASARFTATPVGAEAQPRAPFRVPAVPPTADPTQPGAYGYRPASQLAAELERDAASKRSPDAPAGGSTITVTAIVLATVIVTLDDEGLPTRIETNTPDRIASKVVYVFRPAGSPASHAAPTAATWAATRAALVDATAGVGTIWQA